MTASISTALADLTETKIEIKTDANDCIPSDYGKVSTFLVFGGGSNVPLTGSTNHCFIQSYYDKTVGGALFIVQTALYYYPNEIYKRSGIKTGSSINFTDWIKVTTETDLTALSELQLAQFNNCNNIQPSAKQRVIFAETTYLAANAPTGSNYWAIKAFTLSNIPDYVTQIAVSVDGTLRKTRYYNGLTWSSWT